MAVVFIYLSAPAILRATTNCSEGANLSAPVQSLQRVFQNAILKGVLKEDAAAKFAESSEWSDPFAQASSNLLLGGLQRAFLQLAQDLNDVQRAQVKSGLRAFLKQRAGEHAVAQKASEQVASIIAPEEFILYPNDKNVDTSAVRVATMGEIGGRLVIRESIIQANGDIEADLQYDPFNSDPSKRFLNYQPDATPFIPYPSENLGLTAKRVSDAELQFFDSDKAFLPTFLLDAGHTLPKFMHIVPFQSGQKIYVLVPYQAGSSKGVYVVDPATGKSLRNYAIGHKSLGITYRGHEPVIYYSEKSEGLRTVDLHFVEVWNGKTNSISTRAEYIYPGQFEFNGNHYLTWSEFGHGVAILEMESGTESYVKNKIVDSGRNILPFKFDNDVYLFVQEELALIIKVTAKTSRP